MITSCTPFKVYTGRLLPPPEMVASVRYTVGAFLSARDFDLVCGIDGALLVAGDFDRVADIEWDFPVRGFDPVCGIDGGGLLPPPENGDLRAIYGWSFSLDEVLTMWLIWSGTFPPPWRG